VSANIPYISVETSQSSLESNAKHDFFEQPMLSGLGVTWGNNFHVFASSYSAEEYLSDLLPGTPLLNSGGAFYADAIPTAELMLTNLFGSYCKPGDGSTPSRYSLMLIAPGP